MAIYDILCEIKDVRDAETSLCEFNGFLEDYVSILEMAEGKEQEYQIFKQLFEEEPNLKVCVNLCLSMNQDAIANQIIRYKDSFKLPKGAIVCPYIIYGMHDDDQKAILLTLGDKQEYILAKALYYVMSEPENEYEGTRNEIISLSVNQNNMNVLLQNIERFFIKNQKAGIVQRDLDDKLFQGYDEMYAIAKEIAEYQHTNVREILLGCKDRVVGINQIIATWFLMKKFTYVQYMMDKSNLNKLYAGNVKKQRQVAKEKCDEIAFISYSELWKIAKIKKG